MAGAIIRLLPERGLIVLLRIASGKAAFFWLRASFFYRKDIDKEWAMYKRDTAFLELLNPRFCR